MIEYNAIFLNTAIIMRAKKSILIKMHLPCILFTRRVEKTALRCFRLATLVCDLETLFRLAHRAPARFSVYFVSFKRMLFSDCTLSYKS